MDKDLAHENDFADLVEGYISDAAKMSAAIDALIRVLHKIDDRHWPTDGWDLDTTVSLLNDMRPNVRAKQLELWAADELLERELG